jgi:hypothetical protein
MSQPYKASVYLLLRYRDGIPELREAGWDEAVARAIFEEAKKRDPSVELIRGDPCYPPPEAHPHCRCKHNPMAPMFCSYGHLTECHAGLTCEQAQCGHVARYREDYE